MTNSFREKLKNEVFKGLLLSDKEAEIIYTPKAHFSTGNYLFNTLISGDPYKGMPDNVQLQFAGSQASGKSYFSQRLALDAVLEHDYHLIFIDTEGAESPQSLRDKGFPDGTFSFMPVHTVEDMSTHLMQTIEKIDIEDKVIIVIDSVGMAPSQKEVDDTLENKDKADMTRAKKLKSLFRQLTGIAVQKRIPIIPINHTYADQGTMYGDDIIAGGKGSQYASSIVIQFTSKAQIKKEVQVNSNENTKSDKKKKKEKKVTEISGTILTIMNAKNRHAKEKVKIKIELDYQEGLDKYSGLLDYAIAGGFLKKKGTWLYYKDHSMQGEKHITPEIYEDMMENGLREYLMEKFKYSKFVTDVKEEFSPTVDERVEKIKEIEGKTAAELKELMAKKGLEYTTKKDAIKTIIKEIR